MKVLLAVFAIFVISYDGVYAKLDYVRIAEQLQHKISVLANHLRLVDDKVQSTYEHLNDTADAIDFKIAQDKQIIELQASLKAHRYNKGVTYCINLYNSKSKQLLDELKATLKDVVENQLNVNKIRLFNINKELAAIAFNLTGVNFIYEDDICEYTPNECRLTNNYPNTIAVNTETVNYIEAVTDKIIESVLETAILPTIPNKIDNDIYKPVNICISKL